MAIVMRMFAPGGTRQQYEQVNASMGINGDEDAPDGLIQHVAGLTDDGVVVMDAGPEVYDAMAASMPTHVGDGSGHPVYSHVAAAASDGSMYIVDLWDSPEAFGEFAAAEIAPAAADRIGEVQPTLTPVINVIHGKAARHRLSLTRSRAPVPGQGAPARRESSRPAARAARA